MHPAAALTLTELDVLIVRHGETDYNAQGIIQGQLDTHLNVRGIDQAELLAQELKHRAITHAFTSDLSRAAETARLVMQYHPNVNLIETPLIRERFLGAREGKKGRDPSTKEERATAESSESLYARIRKFWEDEVVRLCFLSPGDEDATPALSSTPQSARSDSPPLPAHAAPASSSTSTVAVSEDITRHETGTINGGEASSSIPSRITKPDSEFDHNNPSLDPARSSSSPAVESRRPLVLVVSHGATISSLIHGLLLSPSYAPKIPASKGSKLPAIQLTPTQVLPSVAEAVQHGHLWNTSVTEVQFRFEHVEGETRSVKSGDGVPGSDSGSKPASRKGLFGWARTSRPKKAPAVTPSSARPTYPRNPPQKELVLVPCIVRYSDITHLGLEDEGNDGGSKHRKKRPTGKNDGEAPRPRPVERVNVDLEESEADDQLEGPRAGPRPQAS